MQKEKQIQELNEKVKRIEQMSVDKLFDAKKSNKEYIKKLIKEMMTDSKKV
jgi:hypothetical protein